MEPKRLTDLRISEIKAIVAEKPLILIPIGTIEWHAGHLPLGVDTLITESVCEDISRGTGVVVAPTLACGISRNLQPEEGYFGTVGHGGGEHALQPGRRAAARVCQDGLQESRPDEWALRERTLRRHHGRHRAGHGDSGLLHDAAGILRGIYRRTGGCQPDLAVRQRPRGPSGRPP